MEGHWIGLDAGKLNPMRACSQMGENVFTQLSPYDVPTHVRASKVDTNLRLEFRYIDEEPAHTRSLSTGIRLRVGKSSGRLLSMEIPLELLHQLGERVVAAAVAGIAVNALRTSPRPQRSRWWAVTEDYLATLDEAVRRGIPSSVLQSAT